MASNYPDGLSDWTPGAPWNQPDIPEMEFEVECYQSLKRNATIVTDNYIPGASGVDYEVDIDGSIAVPWHDNPDTSDINWAEEYENNGYKTPIQLIQLLKEYLQKDLEEWIEEDKKDPHKGAAYQVKKYKSLIKECDSWSEEDIEFIEN